MVYGDKKVPGIYPPFEIMAPTGSPFYNLRTAPTTKRDRQQSQQVLSPSNLHSIPALTRLRMVGFGLSNSLTCRDRSICTRAGSSQPLSYIDPQAARSIP